MEERVESDWRKDLQLYSRSGFISLVCRESWEDASTSLICASGNPIEINVNKRGDRKGKMASKTVTGTNEIRRSLLSEWLLLLRSKECSLSLCSTQLYLYDRPFFRQIESPIESHSVKKITSWDIDRNQRPRNKQTLLDDVSWAGGCRWRDDVNVAWPGIVRTLLINKLWSISI